MKDMGLIDVTVRYRSRAVEVSMKFFAMLVFLASCSNTLFKPFFLLFVLCLCRRSLSLLAWEVNGLVPQYAFLLISSEPQA